MRPFIISTDTTSDLPAEYIAEHQISLHPLHYLIDDTEYGLDLTELKPHDFYQTMRDGKMPTTNATNIDNDIKLMEEAVKSGNDILHLSFSAVMSGSHNNARLAAEEVCKRYPEANIIVIDSKSGTGALGLLVRYAVQLKDEGKSLTETAEWIKETIPSCVCRFTLPDLFHLWRGGRLKKSSAILGTALKIQPVLHIDENGALETVKKVRGRSAAIRAIHADLSELCEIGKKPEFVCITHGDCIEEANEMAASIRSNYGIENVYVSYLSPTLGAHTGPGTLTIGYLGIHK